jgi:hypothetical protein
MSCRHIFKDYNILTVASLYTLTVMLHEKAQRLAAAKCAYSLIITREEKLDLHIQFCNTVLFKKRVVNMGIRLYKKVSNH